MSPPRVLIVGAGGHAKVLLDALIENNLEIIGLTDFERAKWHTELRGIPVLGNDDEILSYNPEDIVLANGIGSIGSTAKRQHIYELFTEKGYIFAKVIHPSSVISPNARLAAGVQVLAGAVVSAGTKIGENSIINTSASVDHDVSIGKHVHVAPGVTISGGVSVGDGTHIGTGASVVQGVHIGKNVIVGAGAVVLHDVADNEIVYGVPARERNVFVHTILQF